MSQLREISEDENRIEMTPMIDVTFLLLVFFMCTIQFKTLEGKLSAYLPRDVGSGGQPSEVEHVEIGIRVVEPGSRLSPTGGPWTGEGRFVHSADRVLEYSIGPRRSLDRGEVLRWLVDVRRQSPEREAAIAAAEDVTHGEVIAVLDLTFQAGFPSVRFAGR